MSILRKQEFTYQYVLMVVLYMRAGKAGQAWIPAAQTPALPIAADRIAAAIIMPVTAITSFGLSGTEIFRRRRMASLAARA